MAKAAQKGTVVEAAMSAGSGAHIGGGPALRGKDIEEAMSAATLKALKDGITDSDKILKLKLAAREKVKTDHRRAAEAAAKRAAKAQKP